MSEQDSSDERCGETRRGILRGGVKAALVLGAAPLLLKISERTAKADQALSQVQNDSLNFLLQLEYLTRNIYDQANDIPGFIPEAAEGVFSTLRDHEEGHVNLLESLLGSLASAEPVFDYSGGGQFNPFGDYASFLMLAQGLEDLSVRAWKGQLPVFLGFPDTLANLSGIHSTEARHAARVRELRGLRPWMSGPPADAPQLAPVYAGQASEAFDQPLTRDEVMVFLSPFLA